MWFIPHGNNLFHKGDVCVKEREKDVEMFGATNVTGSVGAYVGSSSSIEKSSFNLTMRMKEIYNLQAPRHEKLLTLQAVIHKEVCGLIGDLDYWLSNIEL